MKRFFLLLAVAVMTLPTVSAAGVVGARMRILEPSFDFGQVPRKGGDLVREFEFVNEGDEPLVIMDVVTTCSCIKASFARRPVAAGGNGVIKIIYQPNKMEAGVFHKVIRVKSNSKDGVKLITVQGISVK